MSAALTTGNGAANDSFPFHHFPAFGDQQIARFLAKQRDVAERDSGLFSARNLMYSGQTFHSAIS